MLRTISLWAFLALCGTAQAGGFAVVPLRAELGKIPTSSLTVTNTDAAKTFEVRAVRWTQKDRTDSYEQTNDLLLAPTTFKLEKGASQVVRIQLNRKLDASEGAYRVFVDEVAPAKELRAANTLKTLVSMAIPVFVAPASGPVAKGQLEMKASLAKNVVNIELRNTGKANLKLREWVLSSTKGELLKVPSAAYVLTGNTMTGDYPLTIQADGPLKLTVLTDRGSFSADVKR